MSKSLWIQMIALALVAVAAPFSHAQEGLQNKRQVLEGLLYRAGGPGGKRPMRDSTIEELCEKGYSAVMYTYPSEGGFHKGTHNCGGGRSTDYVGTGFYKGGEKTALERIYRAAANNEGPVMVHCWNGYHASGEVAAYALIQFCGWSGDRAADYWGDMMPASERKKVNGVYKSIPARIRKWKKLSGMDFTAEQREKFCHPDTTWD